jgi:Fe-S cluster assembly protein SufD
MKELFLKDEEFLLTPSCQGIINVSGKVIIKEQDLDLNNTYIINLGSDSSLDYYKYNKALTSDVKVTINMLDNSVLNYHYSFECFKPCKITILSNVIGSNNQSNIKINGVTSKLGACYITASATIKENTLDNEINEDVRVLKLNNEESVIKPNLIVNTHNIKATHNTVCKKIDEESLFYLMSKGISKAKAIKLIKIGFLNKNIKEGLVCIGKIL